MYQVVPGTRRGGSFENRTIGNSLLIGIPGDLERSELKWNELKKIEECNEWSE